MIYGPILTIHTTQEVDACSGPCFIKAVQILTLYMYTL